MSIENENLIKFSRAITRRIHRVRRNGHKVCLTIKDRGRVTNYYLKEDSKVRVRGAFIDKAPMLIISSSGESQMYKLDEIDFIQTWYKENDAVLLSHEYLAQSDGQFQGTHYPTGDLRTPHPPYM